MKKKILTVFILCIMLLSTLVGCSPIKLTDNPSTDAPVTSNGGMVIQKGDYIYFINGLVDTSTLSNGDNKYNEVTYGSICRVKAENGVLAKVKDENGEVTDELDVDVVVPKVVGCKTCNFYIFDDYIYYASPTTEKDKTGKSRFDLITFFCCKIDGSETKKLYAVDKYGDEAKFNMLKVGDYVYLEVFDGTNLNILAIKGNKVVSKKQVSKDSTIKSVAFAEIETYNSQNNDEFVSSSDKYIYYTREVLDSEKYSDCNVLCRASLETAEEEIIVADNKNTITLVGYYNGNLYYKASDKDGLSEAYIVYISSIEALKNSNTISASDKVLFKEVTPYIIKSKKYVGVIISDNTELKMITAGGEITVLSENLALTVLGVIGDTVYCYNDFNQIVIVNIPEKSVWTLNNIDTSNFEQDLKFDVCSDFVYTLKDYKGESETGYYLNRFNINSEVFNGEFLGILQDAHKSTETESED